MTLSTRGSGQPTLKFTEGWVGGQGGRAWNLCLLGPCYMPSTGLVALKPLPLLICEVRIMPILHMRTLRRRRRGAPWE